MKEKLMFGHLGSGVRVWDTKQQEHAGYKTVAHIARDRTITYYDEGLSEEAKQTIENFAKFNNMTRSVTQDDLVLDHVDYSQIDIQVLKARFVSIVDDDNLEVVIWSKEKVVLVLSDEKTCNKLQKHLSYKNKSLYIESKLMLNFSTFLIRMVKKSDVINIQLLMMRQELEL